MLEEKGTKKTVSRNLVSSIEPANRIERLQRLRSIVVQSDVVHKGPMERKVAHTSTGTCGGCVN